MVVDGFEMVVMVRDLGFFDVLFFDVNMLGMGCEEIMMFIF